MIRTTYITSVHPVGTDQDILCPKCEMIMVNSKKFRQRGYDFGETCCGQRYQLVLRPMSGGCLEIWGVSDYAVMDNKHERVSMSGKPMDEEGVLQLRIPLRDDGCHDQEIVTQIRPVVMRFALRMEGQLRRHDAKKGYYDGKLDCSTEFLLAKLIEEVGELGFEVQQNNASKCKGEAADVANLAMMLAEHIYRRQFEPNRA